MAWVNILPLEFLALFGIGRGNDMYFADTDPGNPTFAGYKALNVQYFDITDYQMQIDCARFDDLVEILLRTKDSASSIPVPPHFPIDELYQ